MKILSRKFVEK